MLSPDNSREFLRSVAMKAKSSPQAGFSLIELLVALVVTLVISGAVFGVIASGNNAFRREPEISDRNQNIRVAMDMITHDVETGGMELPPLMQVFLREECDTTLLDGEGPPG